MTIIQPTRKCSHCGERFSLTPRRGRNSDKRHATQGTRSYHLGARYCKEACRKAASKARRRSSTVARKAEKTINRRPRQKFCRCFNALRVQENKSRVLPSRPARLPHQCFGRLPLSAGEAGSGRRAMKQESESRSTRFLFVHDGRACCGHLISRGPNGWETFDRHGESVGTFASLRDAAAALPRIAA